MEDGRDVPNVQFDVNGDASYVTQDGYRISGIKPGDGRKYKELETEMRFRTQFPMGMK